MADDGSQGNKGEGVPGGGGIGGGGGGSGSTSRRIQNMGTLLERLAPLIDWSSEVCCAPRYQVGE